jgi:hypothetical protein
MHHCIHNNALCAVCDPEFVDASTCLIPEAKRDFFGKDGVG